MCCHVAQVWEGKGVVASARKIIGATNPLASEPGTIRGDFAIEVGRNVVHGSDSPENGERETGAFEWGTGYLQGPAEGGRNQCGRIGALWLTNVFAPPPCLHSHLVREGGHRDLGSDNDSLAQGGGARVSGDTKEGCRE